MSHGLKDNQPASNSLLKSLLGSEATPPGGGAGWGGPRGDGGGESACQRTGSRKGPRPSQSTRVSPSRTQGLQEAFREKALDQNVLSKFLLFRKKKKTQTAHVGSCFVF